jgi:hypothetical protein
MEWRLLTQKRRASTLAPLHTRTKYILVTSAFAIAWLLSIGCGFAVFARYNNKPGPVGAVPRGWPGLHLERSHDRPTLVMVAHPRCPCTRASIGELAQIMARQQGKLIAYVLFVKPGKADADWDETDLWRSARKIPGVTVLSDSDGVAASRLGAETSGHTFLFAANGQLVFNGGITESRGHAGDNAGKNAIVSLLNDAPAQRKQTFVFGCALTARHTPKQSPKCQ